MADLTTVTPESKPAAGNWWRSCKSADPICRMPSKRLRVPFPGNHGGVNWGGVAFSPQLGYVFVDTSELGQTNGLKDRHPKARRAQRAPIGTRQSARSWTVRTGRLRRRRSLQLRDERQYTQTVTVPAAAVGQPDGGERQHGRDRVARAARRHRQPAAGESRTPAPHQRRPDCHRPVAWCSSARPTTGVSARSTRRPARRCGREAAAAAHAMPMTYRDADGKQYVVITATGGGFFDAPTADDSITAFALPARAPAQRRRKPRLDASAASHAVSSAASASIALRGLAADVLQALHLDLAGRALPPSRRQMQTSRRTVGPALPLRVEHGAPCGGRGPARVRASPSSSDRGPSSSATHGATCDDELDGIRATRSRGVPSRSTASASTSARARRTAVSVEPSHHLRSSFRAGPECAQPRLDESGRAVRLGARLDRRAEPGRPSRSTVAATSSTGPAFVDADDRARRRQRRQHARPDSHGCRPTSCPRRRRPSRRAAGFRGAGRRRCARVRRRGRPPPSPTRPSASARRPAAGRWLS